MVPPFVEKRDEEFNSDYLILENKNVHKGNSIANRRAENCGFNASSLSPCMLPSFITVSPGISPSELLGSPMDSPIMLPNAQAQASPTTGRCSSPSHDSARLCSGDSSSIEIAGRIIFDCANEIMMQKEEAPPVEGYSEYLQDTIAKTRECKNWWEIECLQQQEQEPNCKINNRNNKLLMLQYPPSNQEQKQQQQKCWDDGYSWRKYGQKQVKGSEFPRSYYKCTSSNCDVTKKVERSLDGQISEIVYKGSHNHPPVSKPTNNEIELSVEDEPPDPPPDPPPPPPIFNADQTHQQLDHSPNADQVSPQNHELLGGGGEDEHTSNDPKRRKIKESLGVAGPSHETSAAARSGREPKVVFQIKSEIDILEDGYRWRKYGQKVVKGNPNPRSYYKCTTPDCFVRKHVERAANDIESVVTTYEGKHNHKVPSSRNSTSSAISAENVTVPLTNSTTLSTPLPMPVPIPMPHKSARVRDQRPLYLQERKPILNYNEFMTSNLATSFRPPIYPYSFSTGFHSLPTYTSTPFIMNNNIPMNNYPVVNPDCMSISSMSPVNHISGSSSNASIDHISSFQYNNYVAPMQPSSNQGQEIKEEPLDHENKVIYDDHIFQSLPGHEN